MKRFLPVFCAVVFLSSVAVVHAEVPPYDDSNLAPAGFESVTAMPDLPVFNVHDYGAVGDGTTDDTVAIRDAIAASNAAGGGIVFFPAGTYAVMRQPGDPAAVAAPAVFTVTNPNTVFLGSGTSTTRIIGYMPGFQDPDTTWVVTGDSYFKISRFTMFVITASGAGSVQFRSLTIDGNATFTGNHTVGGIPATGDGWDMSHKGIAINGQVGSVLVFNSSIGNWRGENIHNSKHNLKVYVINSHIYGSNASSVSVPYVHIKNSLIGGYQPHEQIYNGFEGFAFADESVVIEDSQFVVSRATGTKTGNAIVYIGLQGASLRVERSRVERAHYGILFSETGHNVTVKDNVFYNNDHAMIDSILGVYPTFPKGFSNFSITGNRFESSGSAFIDQNAGVLPNFEMRNNTVISGNLLSGNFKNSTGTRWPNFIVDSTVFGTGGRDVTGYSGYAALWTNSVRTPPLRISAQVKYDNFGTTATSTLVKPVTDVTLLNVNRLPTSVPHAARIDPATLPTYPVGFETLFTLYDNASSKNWVLPANSLWNTFPGDVSVTAAGVPVRVNEQSLFELVNNTRPTVDTTSASASTTSSVLRGTIRALGGVPVTESGFVFGTTATLATGASTSTLGAQVAVGTFEQQVTSLVPLATYYYRAYATNSLGTTFGAIKSFATYPTAEQTQALQTLLQTPEGQQYLGGMCTL